MIINVKVNIDENKIIERFKSNLFGLKLASEWKKQIDPYVPRNTGYLMNNITIKPFEIVYHAPYAHFQYMGVVYEDPDTHSAWARKGVKKIIRAGPQALVYDLSKNPYATSEWDKAARDAGKVNNLAQIMSDYLQRRVL